jgi:RNA recognition motif-containing protein
MELWLGNLDPEATDDELKELAQKYSQMKVTQIRREAGDGSRPGAILEFADASPEKIHSLQQRLHGMYWKKRAISAYIPMRTGLKK